MDRDSDTRWDDYTGSRDDMFQATDTAWAPWFVARSDNKRQARLNIIAHILSSIPYKKVSRADVKLPKRKIARSEPLRASLSIRSYGGLVSVTKANTNLSQFCQLGARRGHIAARASASQLTISSVPPTGAAIGKRHWPAYCGSVRSRRIRPRRVDESNPVRAVDVFVDALELRDLGVDGVDVAATGRPAYHPSLMLKLYIYGYLSRFQSSRRLEREAGRNLEVMWLTGRLVPDHKTIADFRKDNGPAIRKVCAQFVELCRKMGLLAKASVAVDGSKFKAVNSRDNNFTQGKIKRRQKQIEESVARYMSQLDTADRRTAAGEEPVGSGAADQDAA